MSFTNKVEWQFYTRGGAEWKFYIRVGWHLVGKCRTSGMSHVLVEGLQISIAITLFQARMADMKNLKPRLSPFLAFSKERRAALKAVDPFATDTELNRKVQDMWEQMPEEQKAVYVKMVSAH